MLDKIYNSFEINILLTILFGFIFGAFSYSIEVTLISLILYECILIALTENYVEKIQIRIILTFIYLISWVLGNYFYMSKTGLERYYFWENIYESENNRNDEKSEENENNRNDEKAEENENNRNDEKSEENENNRNDEKSEEIGIN